MKVEIPSKFKYKTKETSISLATSGPDRKKIKLTYVDDKLFVELPLQVDVRQAIEKDLEYTLHIDLNEKPIPARSLNVKANNTSNAVLSRLGYLEGQEKEESKGRKILLKYQKKREEKEAISRSGSSHKKNEKRSLADSNSNSGINQDNNSDELKDTSQSGPSDMTRKIANSFPFSEKSQNDFKIGKTQKINRVIRSIRERDLEDLEKIKYNSAITIKRSQIDYSSIVPNKIVQSLDKLNDELAFGTRVKYVLGHPTNPGKRRSRARREAIYSRQKKGSEIDIGLAEKNFEKAEIDAFSEKQKNEFESADKIISEIKDNVDGEVTKGSNTDKLQAELSEIRQKQKSNRFIDDIRSLKELEDNANQKSKKVSDIRELSNESTLNNKNKISALKSVKSINSKEKSINKNRVASLSIESKDNVTEEFSTSSNKRSRKGKKVRSKTMKYQQGEASRAKKSIKSMIKRKIDPAKLLQSNKPTHYTIRDMSKSLSLPARFLPKPKIKEEVNSLISDPVNTHGRPNMLSDKTQDKISLVSNVLVELPYELVESEEAEDFDLVDQSEYAEEKNRFPIVFTKKVVNRRRFLKHVIEVQADQVFNDRIYCTIHVKDRKTKTKINSKRFILDLNSLKSQFLYPEPSQLPSLKVTSPNKEGEYSVSIQNNHVIPIIAELYEKKFVQGKNLTDVRYKLLKKIELQPDQIYKKEMTGNRGNTSQFRLKFSTILDDKFVEISNIITPDTDFEQKNINDNNVSLFAYQKNSEGIYVTAKSLPLNASTIKFFRKQIDVDGGNTPQKNAKFSELTYASGEEVGFLTVINPDLGIRILDRNVKDDTAYQYKVDVISSSGTKIENSALDNSHFVEPNNLVQANLRYVGGTSALGNYNFVLELKQETTNVEDIINKFKSERFELFKDKIDNLTKTLLQEPTADVFLINTKTGVESKLGEFNNNSLVTVTVSKNYNYIILVKPKSFNPELVLSELNRLSKFVDDLAIDSNTIASKRKQAIDALKQKRSREEIPFRPEKFFSRKAKKGIIDSAENKAANFHFDVQLGNYTGDNFVKKINNKKRNKFGAKPGKINVLPNNYTYVSFSTLGEIKKVDFYFVSVKKEGSQFPLTTLMATKNAATLSFMDYNNSEYLGRIDYYVQAVFIDGSISNPNYIGTCALLDKQYL